ncbi:MAG: A/G-specific adenine glycosylase [Fimbriimonadia bacterium]
MNDRDLAALRRRLLGWYEREKRDLAWRKSDDLYPVLVSEVMLQQTRVGTVGPYFERFMERFPDLRSLAAASEQEVLAVWQGLGYYRRAVNLRLAAQRLVAGPVPHDVAGFRDMPGIGEYSAAALASRVYGVPVAAVDGNVERVVARLFGIEGKLDAAPGRAAIREGARELLDRERSGDWNQAMMELGARVCVAGEPRCAECPVSVYCRAHAEGLTDRIPARPESRAPVRLSHACAVLTDGRRAKLVQIGPDRWWSGLWEFPRTDVSRGESTSAAARRAALGSGVSADDGVPLPTVTHTVTHHRISLHPVLFRVALGPRSWTRLDLLGNTPMPAPQRVVADHLLAALSE